MNLQGGEKVKTNELIYITQAVNNILSVSRLVSKGAMTGATKEKININKGVINMALE